MELSDRPKYKSGFTLIELLVVTSATMLIITIMMPVLSKTRNSAKAIICFSNQGQMIRGWSVAMINNADQIPRTINAFDPIDKPWEDWSEVLFDTMGRVGDVTYTGLAHTGTMACPHIETQFSGPSYDAHHYGYAINCRMRKGHLYGDNEGIKWSLIRSPSTYPWFTDPFIIESGGTPVAKRYFGAVSTSDWGVGFYHGQGTGSAAYADGHVAAITNAVLVEGPVDNSAAPEPVPLWLLDTP